MKEFEKWLDNREMYEWNYDEKDAAEMGWKAALEWVMGEPTWKESIDSQRYFIDMRMVEKELEIK